MIPTLVVCVALAVMLGAFLWMPIHLHRHPEKRSATGGSSAGLGGSIDEIFHPEAHAARIAIDEQQRWVQPAPSPDGDKGVQDGGRVRIVLPDRRSGDR